MNWKIMHSPYSPIIQEKQLSEILVKLSKKFWAEDKHGKIQAQRRNFQKFRSKWKQGVIIVQYLLPGTKYIRYYLLLKAFQRGSIWFQWGLAFIPSSSWTEHSSTGRSTNLPGWHSELVTLSRLDHKSLLSPGMPRKSHMTKREFNSFFLLQVDSSALICVCVYIFRVPTSHSFSLHHISPRGGSDINLVPCWLPKLPALFN